MPVWLLFTLHPPFLHPLFLHCLHGHQYVHRCVRVPTGAQLCACMCAHEHVWSVCALHRYIVHMCACV
jgi:hypothetical protein